MIRAVVFDLDDTLFPEREFVLSGFQAVDVWLRSEKAINGFFGHALAEYSAGRRGDVFDAALERCGIPRGGMDIQQLVQLYRAHRPNIRLHADARWAIAHFGATKKLGIITDGYRATQRNKVSALGIESSFAAIIYSDDFGRECWKPSVIPYQKFCETAACLPGECVYVGDNPRKDFFGANQLGWLTVQVRRADGVHRDVEVEPAFLPRWKISSLTELADVMRKNEIRG